MNIYGYYNSTNIVTNISDYLQNEDLANININGY
jgi:hypothetical protein